MMDLFSSITEKYSGQVTKHHQYTASSYKSPFITNLNGHNHVKTVSDTIIEELELDSIYKEILPIWGDTPGAKLDIGKYTTDISFLTKTQEQISYLKEEKRRISLSNEDVVKPQITPSECAKMRTDIHQFYGDVNFFHKHNFADFSGLEFLNRNSDYMNLSIYSQYLTFMMHFIFPIHAILFPFILLFLTGRLNMSAYIEQVCQILKKNFIGKQIFKLNASANITLLLLVLWGGYYAVQGYLSINSIRRFTNHLFHAKELMRNIEYWCQTAYREWDTNWSEHITLYSPLFVKQMMHYTTQWKQIIEKTSRDYTSLFPKGDTLWETLLSKTNLSFSTLKQSGEMLVTMYELFCSPVYESALLIIPDWLEYANSMHEWANKNSLTKATFIERTTMNEETAIIEEIDIAPNTEENKRKKKKRTPYMKQHIYPVLSSKNTKGNIVANNSPLNKNGILTGINASGKTTHIKSLLLNILLTQQIGMGFYKECCLQPYTHFHLYMNVPDTNGRDSLFQSEARKCKIILDEIQSATNENPHSHHFCAFDELFSGTNPNDANRITFLFLEYMALHFKNTQFWITTHFHKVCQKLKKRKLSNIEFYFMPDDLSYQLSSGISQTENALHVLRELNYPNEILIYL